MTVLLILVETNFKHRLTDLHLSKLIMTVLTFRDISKFASVNTANFTSELCDLATISWIYTGKFRDVSKS